MSYDVDDLFLFAKITAYHSLNDASKELGLTASYITRFIQKLEGELGHPLIITTRNGFVPSYFGSALGNRFGSYNELFNLELMNALSLFKRYKATFNLYLTSLVADFAIKNLLEIAKEFDGVSFNFFQHSGETYSKDFLTNAQFGIVAFPSRNITDKYVAENSTLINSAYYEIVCTEEYVRNYGAPSTLEQLQEHSSRIIASSNRPIYASLGSDETDPVLITSQPAISSNGGMLNALIRTNHYIGVILVLPLIHNDLITILPKYNFGIVYGYLFENKLLTRQYPKELINIIRKNILNSCTELMNLIR